MAELTGHRPGRDRGIDPLVVGDRDHVEPGRALDVLEDLEDARGPVGGQGMDVEVRMTQASEELPAPPRHCQEAMDLVAPPTE